MCLILISILYLKNVLSKKKFDDDDLYIHNKQNVKIFTIFIRDDVYIMNHIKFKLNEIAISIIIVFILIIELILTISLTTLLIIINTNENYTISFNSMQMQLNESNHDFSNFENNASSKNNDLYIL